MTIPLNILVAEDLEDDVFLLKQAFNKAQVTSRLESVKDGMEAQAYLKGEGAFADRTAHPFPDILLLDLNMPRMNGFELLEWMRQDEQCRRVVTHVLTASSREADVDRAYELGANSYVLKPSRIGDLVAFVKALHEWHRFTVLPQKMRAEAR